MCGRVFSARAFDAFSAAPAELLAVAAALSAPVWLGFGGIEAAPHIPHARTAFVIVTRRRQAIFIFALRNAP
jgi:hypothetical protein